MKIKRALADRPRRHRTKDMSKDNYGELELCAGPQATRRNLKLNLREFPLLAPQTQSS